MATFWRLLEESVIIQGVLTLGIWTAIFVLLVMGKAIPEILSAGGYTILGFWFGSKSSNLIAQASARTAAAVVEAAGKSVT